MSTRPTKISEQLRDDLAKAALAKRRRGEMPTVQERNALKQYEREREEKLRFEHYRTVPKKHYLEMSGRGTKVVLDQADRLGLPLRGKTVDLFEVIRGFHDVLAKNAHVLRTDKSQSKATEWTEKVRQERATLLQLKRLEAEDRLVERARVIEALELFGSFMREAATTLETEFGQEAHAILQEAIEDFEREAAERFGDPPHDNGHANNQKPAPRNAAARGSVKAAKAPRNT